MFIERFVVRYRTAAGPDEAVRGSLEDARKERDRLVYLARHSKLAARGFRIVRVRLTLDEEEIE